MSTVRDGAFDVLRRLGLTTVFSNPGSTEISLLTDLPEDLEFVLALHEASVVGMATGWALAREQPALVVVHTTAGLGNAVGALATARVNRAPLVVVVGQQDRRHLANEPFLAGHRLELLAGDYPVWVGQPPRAQDVPGTIARAFHEAATGRGPALVVVPMDDWEQPLDAAVELPAPARVARAVAPPTETIDALAARLDGAAAPAIVAGAGNDTEPGWAALTALAERLACPVWQEAFGGRAGFPQDHRCFGGHLPADRAGLRDALAGHDVVLVVGAPVFRQYPFAPGPLLAPETRVLVVSDDPDEVHRSPAEVAVLAAPAEVCAALAARVAPRGGDDVVHRRAPEPAPGAGDGSLSAAEVFDVLGARLPADTIVVEETPSSRSELHARLPARAPLGFLSAAMGGLGFAMPAAVGLRLADGSRPVVAVVGDGSSMYSIQALWSAAHYGAGVLFVVLVNGRYAIMDALAARQGGSGPWPDLDALDVAAVAAGVGCPTVRVDDRAQLAPALDTIVPTLRDRAEPVVLCVDVAVDARLAGAAPPAATGARAA